MPFHNKISLYFTDQIPQSALMSLLYRTEHLELEVKDKQILKLIDASYQLGFCQQAFLTEKTPIYGV